MASNTVVISSNPDGWQRLRNLVLDSVSAPSSKKNYALALDRFHHWYLSQPRSPLSKAVVQEYKAMLERAGYAPATIALQLAAIRKLAMEAADNGLMDPYLAAGVCRIHGPRRHGARIGNWLTSAQASALVNAPPSDSLKGKRDRAILATAVGCGLRRSELAGLTVAHLQLRDDRPVIADVIGKHNRIRTVPVPGWVRLRLEQWLTAATITTGPVFRGIDKADRIVGESLTPQAIYEVTKTYGYRTGQCIAPHDLRRTFAKLARAGQAPLEQIQFALGHASITTTERYLGLRQDLSDAPGDHIRLDGLS